MTQMCLPCILNPHQRCGYSDSPFARKDTFLYCRLQKWVGRGWHPWHGDTKRKLYLRKIHFFVIEKYVEDVKQEETDVSDLLEAISCKRRVTAKFDEYGTL